MTNKEIRIILLGPSGSGKSRTGNNLGNLTPAFKVGHGGKPVTLECELANGKLFGKRLRIIDTPGIWGEEGESKASLDEIKKSVPMAYEGPHVFLLVTEMGRVVDFHKIMLRYEHLFGKAMFKYSIMLFTNFDVWKDRFKDEIGKDQDPDVDQYIRDLPKGAKEILKKCENRFAELDNRCSGDEMEGQLRTLMEKIKLLITTNNDKFYTEAQDENSTENRNSSEQLNNMQANDGNRSFWIIAISAMIFIGGIGILFPKTLRPLRSFARNLINSFD